MKQERWKDIPGYDGRYQISTNGRVRRVRSNGCTRLVTPYCRSRYHMVKLYKPGSVKTYSVHRLVLLLWVGPCPDGYEACHNNGDSFDNRVSNLRWGTHKENMLDKRLHGTNRTNPTNRKPVICSDGRTFNSLSDASLATGYNASHISKVCKGLVGRTGPYTWSFAKPITEQT